MFTINNREFPSGFKAIMAVFLSIYALMQIEFVDNIDASSNCIIPLFSLYTYIAISSFMTIIMYITSNVICDEAAYRIITKIDRLVMVAFICYAAIIKDYYGNCANEMRTIWCVGILFYEYKNYSNYT
jgi:hypothetical protein